jgi:hypothetical protein
MMEAAIAALVAIVSTARRFGPDIATADPAKSVFHFDVQGSVAK